ncbi:MAG: 6-bladed beta-propeller [Nitrospinota bacterium]
MLFRMPAVFFCIITLLFFLPGASFAKTEYIFFFSLTGYDRAHKFGKLSSFDVYNNEIYISDSQQKTIAIFDIEGNLLSRFGKERNLGGRPEQLIVAHDKIFIRISLKRNIEIFNILGRKVGEITPPYKEFDAGLMAATEDGIAIFDKKTKKMCFFNQSGKLLSNFSLKDKIRTVAGFTYNNKKVYISSMDRSRALSIFTKNGKFIKGIGQVGNSSSQFAVPAGVVVDKDGIIWVVDAFKQRAVGYYQDGKKHSSITGQWTHMGSFNYPELVRFGGGLIFVMETGTNNISVLKKEQSPQKETNFDPF